MFELTTVASPEHQLITVGFYCPELGVSFRLQLTPNEAAVLAARLKEELAKCGKQSKP